MVKMWLGVVPTQVNLAYQEEDTTRLGGAMKYLYFLSFLLHALLYNPPEHAQDHLPYTDQCNGLHLNLMLAARKSG